MVTKGHRFTGRLAAALLLGCMSAAAHAAEPLDLRQTYSGTSAVDVEHIETMNDYTNGGIGTTNSFSIGAGAYSFDDPFLKSSANRPTYTFFMGVSTDDAETAHLVLAVASAYAAGLVSGGQDFSEIFPNYSENSLISDLTLIDGTFPDEGTPEYTAVQNARSELVNFGADIEGRGGWAPAFNGPMTLLSFSSALEVGSGFSNITDVGTAAPEPASWALMIAGFGMIGGALRTRGRKLRLA